MTTLATEHEYDECAPYQLTPERSIYTREPVPRRRACQYVGPIFDADGTTNTYAPTPEPEDQS